MTCSTKTPAPMLDTAADVETHAFQAMPENHAKESTVFKDGATRNDDRGQRLRGPRQHDDGADGAGEGREARRTSSEKRCRRSRWKHQDALIKTPLGNPKAAMALRESDEGKLAISRGDRICFDKDQPMVIPSVQRCARAMVIDWSKGR